ncbi:MAG: hypothetical protein A3I89_02615 [Candidatus Harrisonbacteria bacterium RIFCSPLOWO2_02_FULL_41_11]|uniref:Metallo-beta-lactamase domain-containing protein n=1 Tax=Candidatus Harrisonbacteria bacterium RIFCSPHIGHO2_02_FULL_42_16 TaxID=1798404 RepID=A0A1G1ZL54_9BACT|nr:MAG: hypothetical protein A3B92_00330 [Candidatus Harrisonbacteria bacterium RIFCSPHIGHO2_02_FULL_42_16]OGY66552.1 MAG: hypothetical protein A3I89_02615 [Candidatus Harrisonbacteria bacterium RIFCSPLOWO2_02_FULL_41_11]
MLKEDKFLYFKIIAGVTIAVDVLIWALIIFPAEAKNPELYFLDVGQGDSSLVSLPGGVKMLIDGGPINGKLDKNLEAILPINTRYIDLVMISHPQLDHFGGLIEILKNYEVGAVLTSNQISEQAAWQELEKIIKEKGIRRIILAAGARIKYRNSYFDILSPRTSDWAKDINDMSIVTILNTAGIKAFFGGDISAEKERELALWYGVNVDILKTSHHGSRFSSDPVFLKEASPAVSVVEVGKNSYGHPTKQALDRLASAGSQIYRTDQNGFVKIIVDNGQLRVYNQKQ